jgi:hypothetical protein
VQFHAKKGKVQVPERDLEILGDTVFQDLSVEDNYKYLGIQQLIGNAYITARKQVENNILTRIEKVFNIS